MKTIKIIFAVALVLLITGNFASAKSKNGIVFQFETMVPVDGPFLGNTNPIRDVPGGGLPWVLTDGKGKLRADGNLDVKVNGLIIPASVEGFGFNPAPFLGLWSAV